MRCTRIAAGCLALVLAAGPALAQDSEPEDDSFFDRGGFTRMDDLRGKSVGIDELKKGAPAALDEGMVGGSDSLDTLSGGSSRTIEQTREENQGWQPPPCEERARADAGAAPAGDVDGWELALGKAEKGLEDTHERWKKLELGVVQVRVEDPKRQAAANREARDQAREAYSRARCDLVDTVLQARAAGVPPGKLRPFVERMPEDLKP